VLPGETEQVVVCVTSYPERIDLAWCALWSLLLQTYPSRVVLVLSLEEFQGDTKLPSSLELLKKKGLEIMWTTRNCGCHNKIQPMKALHQHAVLVTADDDTFYPRWWLRRLMSAHASRPRQILAHRARRVRIGDDGSIAPYLRWGPARLATPSARVFPTAVGGVLYPPRSLPDVAFDTDLALRLSETNDDIWLWAMRLLAGTPARPVSNEFRRFDTVPGTQSTNLRTLNIRGGKNDEYIARVTSYFDLLGEIK
jgi:hypothetical protein